MGSFGGSDVTTMCKPLVVKKRFQSVRRRLLAHVPEGDRDKNEDDHNGAVAHPLWYRVPHPEPPFICSE